MPSGGSHPPYSRHVRALVESQLQAGIAQKDIAGELAVSKSWVSQLRAVYDTWGSVNPPPVLAGRGRPRKIYTEAEEGIKDFLNDYPTARRDEI
jgi:transposase